MLRVFDNGGSSFDRYTIFIAPDAYGMSNDATGPGGFNQYIGYPDEFDEESLGKEMTCWTDLPKDVQRAIIQRMTTYIEE